MRARRLPRMEQALFFCIVETYARFLWEAKIVQVRTNPPWFRWASGIESPIYVDHRRLLSHPEWRRWAVQTLVQKLNRSMPSFRAVVGVATGGIAWAAWIGEAMQRPVGYVRPQPKSHGLARRVEGLSAPMSVLLVEDLISTGESLRKSAEALESEGYPVVAAAALWSYELPGTSSLPYPVCRLLTFPEALLYWLKAGYLNDTDIGFLRSWHRQMLSS